MTWSDDGLQLDEHLSLPRPDVKAYYSVESLHVRVLVAQGQVRCQVGLWKGSLRRSAPTAESTKETETHVEIGVRTAENLQEKTSVLHTGGPSLRS